MQRTKLSELDESLRRRGLHLKKSQTTPYIRICTRSRVLFQLNRDDLFDRDGNRFEDDLP